MSEDEIYLENSSHFDVRLIPERQDESFGLMRWENIPAQIYPGWYIAKINGSYSLFDIANYIHVDFSRTAMDIGRMWVRFGDEQLFLREKIEKSVIDMRLLQNKSVDFEDPKKNAELNKLIALFPEGLDPRLFEFLLYNLHHHSLCSSPAMVLLKNILYENYNCVLPSQQPDCNSWTIHVETSTDGKSFSLTNTNVVDRNIKISDGELRDIENIIEVSSKFLFRVKDDGGIEAKCEEIYIQSYDAGLVKIFRDRISKQLNQDKIIYIPPSTLDVGPSANEEEEVPAIQATNNDEMEITLETAEANDEKYNNIHCDGSMCESVLQDILVAFTDGKKIHNEFFMLIMNIQKEGFRDFSAEQLDRFQGILPMFTDYRDSLIGNSSDKEACERALSLNEQIINYFYLEILGGNISEEKELLENMKIPREETESAVNNRDISYKVAAEVVQQVNLELINCLSYLVMPKKQKFEPVSQKRDWNRIFQENVDLISPKKRWEHNVLTAIGVTLAVGFGAALAAGFVIATGGLGVVPLAVVGFAISSVVSPTIAAGVVGLVSASIMGISIAFECSRRKDVELSAKQSRAYIHNTEGKINRIKEPIEKQKIKLEEESAQKKQSRNIDPNYTAQDNESFSPEIIAVSSAFTFFSADSSPVSGSEISDTNSNEEKPLQESC